MVEGDEDEDNWVTAATDNEADNEVTAAWDNEGYSDGTTRVTATT